ncbi:MAG TPA: glucose 1-dehydrogenase [Abditibacteriaceae bacterium]|nr:glucose 1-dehydrogenase [Abditibacteriaceae bacterium]
MKPTESGTPLPDYTPQQTLAQFSLEGKVAVVTGASRGLGEAMAEALAGAGADVALLGREQSTLDEVAQRLQDKTKRKIYAHAADVGKVAAIEAAVPAVVKELGRLDILVNNAGINFRVPALEVSEAQWDAVSDVNLKGAFFLARECGKVMTAQRSGKIINILSLTSFLGLPTVVPYSAAKGGMNQLTKLMAVEWADDNVQVNAIAPGYFRTAMTQPVRDDQRNAWVLNRTPAGRWGEPAELCGALLFFAANASNFITGQILYIDGGFTAGSDWRKGDIPRHIPEG